MMDMVASPQAAGPGPNGVNGTPFATIDPVRVVEHLALLLEVALGATREELEAPGSLLSKGRHADTLQRCVRFAGDSMVSLYIQKDLAASPQIENGDADSRRPRLSL